MKIQKTFKSSDVQLDNLLTDIVNVLNNKIDTNNIKDSGIATGKIEDSAITTDKIAAGAVTQSSRLLLTSGDLNTTNTSFEDASGVTITLTTGANPVLIIFQAIVVVASGTSFDIAIDGTRQGGIYGLFLQNVLNNNQGINITYLSAALTAGSHIFKIQWKATSGTSYIQCDADAPIHFAVIEIKK